MLQIATKVLVLHDLKSIYFFQPYHLKSVGLKFKERRVFLAKGEPEYFSLNTNLFQIHLTGPLKELKWNQRVQIKILDFLVHVKIASKIIIPIHYYKTE